MSAPDLQEWATDFKKRFANWDKAAQGKSIDLRPNCQRCHSKLTKNHTMDWWECPACPSIEHVRSDMQSRHRDTECPNTLYRCVSSTPVDVERMRPTLEETC